MRLDKVMWGIILLFVGGVLLLENFHVIDFYWRNVWRFWPIFLIIGGVNILFNKNKSQLGSVISIVILVITLCLLFFKGQESPGGKRLFNIGIGGRGDHSDSDSSSDRLEHLHFAEPFVDVADMRTVLNISGGGTSFSLSQSVDSLITADVKKRGGIFTVKNASSDGLRTVDFKMKGNSNWSVSEGGNEVDLRLNRQPKWEINVNLGAGSIDFDLSDYKISDFNFDGGAAALAVKFGALLPLTNVNVKTGIADVKIKVPEVAGCKIRAKTGLSSKEFKGFKKMSDGTFESANYESAVNKIIINLDGGLSNFEVSRY